MLSKLLKRFRKRETLEEYQEFLKKLVAVSFAFVLLFLCLAYLMRTNSFASGLLTGMGSALAVLVIYYAAILRQPQKVKQLYIEANDERNKEILALSAVGTLIVLVVVIILLVLMYAFAGLTLNYVITLIILLYVILVGFLLIRWLLNKVF